MRPRLEIAPGDGLERRVACALAGLLLVDVDEWRDNSELPPHDQIDWRYFREPEDRWSDLLTCYKRRSFDCEDIACIVAAEGRVRNSHPYVYVYAVRVTPRLIHLYNGDGRGKYYDFCRARGMHVPRGLDLDALYKRGVKCPL